jgi:hypothetical protein
MVQIVVALHTQRNLNTSYIFDQEETFTKWFKEVYKKPELIKKINIGFNLVEGKK